LAVLIPLLVLLNFRIAYSCPPPLGDIKGLSTLHNILVGVLLCIVVATGLAVSCLSRGTCCRRYLVFASTAIVVFPGVEADAVVAVVVEALALWALALADDGPLLLIAGLHELLFPARFAVA
jgi:hypothetical protein